MVPYIAADHELLAGIDATLDSQPTSTAGFETLSERLAMTPSNR
jgi:hypothetical protein